MTELWLCLNFEQLPLEICIRGLRDDGAAPAAAVVTEHGRVIRLNEAARALGIDPGSSMDTALTLSSRLCCFERNPDSEYAALDRLARWAWQFTPGVAVKAPDCLLLEVSGCLRLFKGIDALISRIREGLERLGHDPTIAQGRTPAAAVLAAKSGHPGTPGPVADSLGSLAINRLDVDADIIRSLEQMGISTLGNLLALPTSGLSRRFGVLPASPASNPIRSNSSIPNPISSARSRFSPTSPTRAPCASRSNGCSANSANSFGDASFARPTSPGGSATAVIRRLHSTSGSPRRKMIPRCSCRSHCSNSTASTACPGSTASR